MPITRAQVADVTEIVALVNSAYRGETSKQGWTSESHLLEGIRIDEVELTGYFDKPEVAILKYTNEGNEIIGSVYLEQTKSNKLYLGMLTVKPTLQAGGIGRKLLAAADDYARELGITTIKISVITSRRELIAWYERRGFVATGETMPLVTATSVAKEPVELMIMEKVV
ncbi:GNAT family N-acetyltransferase [Mucilaginibacter lacusdianchii]|uniref:GNAT family N-acetyltransferase n=1 Tax=Mucilaginibacter lacusdianchii TaxID=2684211 RepID=UPI00131DD606|nr:GNAT family N-acetyltransferase [Mucilaginibacter sp. JXJ CY 39]